MNRQDVEKTLNLRWTWYLFLGANLLSIIGIAISWGLAIQSYQASDYYRSNNIALIICNVIAALLLVVFYYLDSKELILIRQHVPYKHFTIYFVAGFVFIASLIFCFIFGNQNIIYRVAASIASNKSPTITAWNAAYGILFGVTAFLSLISIAFYRYARYCIDLTLYRRRHGELAKTEEEIRNQKIKDSNLTEDEYKKMREDTPTDNSGITTPTAGLIKHVDKE